MGNNFWSKTSQEIPAKYLTDLTKEIRKYEEQVNRCEISNTNVLAERIGSDMDYLRHALKITEEQKQEVKLLEDEFARHMDNLKKCRCVKKIEK
jgi:hypothetical protein